MPVLIEGAQFVIFLGKAVQRVLLILVYKVHTSNEVLQGVYIITIWQEGCKKLSTVSAVDGTGEELDSLRCTYF